MAKSEEQKIPKAIDNNNNNNNNNELDPIILEQIREVNKPRLEMMTQEELKLMKDVVMLIDTVPKEQYKYYRKIIWDELTSKIIKEGEHKTVRELGNISQEKQEKEVITDFQQNVKKQILGENNLD